MLRGDAIWCPIGTDVVTVYCGLPPQDIIVADCTPADLAWLRSLDGLSPWSLAVERARSSGARRAGALIRALLRTGGLDDAASMPDSWRFSSRRQATDRSALLDSGLTPWEANDQIDRRHSCVVAIIGTGYPAELAFQWCREAGLDPRPANLNDEERPPGTRIALLIEIGHPLVVSGVDTAWHAIPHLPVRLLGTSARVGPLVRPGLSGCLRCAHLHAVDRWRHWAERAWQAQSVVRPTLPDQTAGWDSATGHLVISLAVRMIRSACDGEDHPAGQPGIAYDIEDHDAIPRAIAQPPHPLCGCQWDQANPAA